MNVTETQTSYGNYMTKTTDSKETKSTEFSTLMQETKNTRQDLLNIEVYRDMLEDDKKEIKKKLIEEYGGIKGDSYSFALYHASQYSDKNMQNAIFDTFSNMSKNEGLDFMLDFQLSTNRYLSGGKLEAGYSINLNKDSQIDYGSPSINLNSYLNNINKEEFINLFSTLNQSHISLQKIAGEQATKYAKVYEDILNSYNNYTKKNTYYG